MAYSADTFVADEQPTTAKWNKLWSNDASFNDGTGIADNAILQRHLSDAIVGLSELAQITKYRNLGYSKTAMSDGSTITGIPLCGVNLPTDWVSGTSVTFKCTSRNTSGSGVVVRRLDSYRFRNAAALTAIDSSLNVNRTVASTSVVYSTLTTIAAGSLAAGDGLAITLNRVGADGADTNTGIEDCDLCWMEYTGRA